jgi:hypothetical protein
MFHVQIGPKPYWIGNTFKGSAQRKLRWAQKKIDHSVLALGPRYWTYLFVIVSLHPELYIFQFTNSTHN